MELWNRERALRRGMGTATNKGSTQYGISAVALGKVCDKLQIPLPGRGYWTKKEFGKPVDRVPLPRAEDLPLVQRFTFPSSEQTPSASANTPKEAPTDPEYLRIVDLESHNTAIVADGPRHELVKAAEKASKQVQPDDKGILQPRYDEPCLEIRVSKGATLIQKHQEGSSFNLCITSD